MSGKGPNTRILSLTRGERGEGLGLAIEQSATWSLKDAQSGVANAQTFAPTTFYTRWGNPTTRRLENAVAHLEHADGALATASGMGAVSTALIAYARRKKHAVAQRSLYTASHEMLSRVLADFDVKTDFVPGPDTDAFAAKVTRDTAFVYLESPSNPLMQITDIRAVSEVAADKGVPVIVDNTFPSPLNQRPLELGATVSLHSATKYLGGHSDVTGGILAAGEEALHKLWDTYKMLGPTLAPNDAFLIHRGIKTLGLRIERHNANALRLARFLSEHPRVEKVHYPGLPDHPGHEVAKRQMDGFGGMLSFEVKGGYDVGRRMMEACQVCVLGVSLGGVESLIQHPASTSHGPLSPEERKVAGIPEGLIRLSVGIEDIEDLEGDLDRALSVAAGKEAPAPRA
ncbi:MAG: aminotransferase class I/II-fold pyridoxal phosphate-dependent enzyme [Euryarchaeota archaeon]|nr:aminotransferase class I/II-fold pyridoxal phosphate-dependent enzyme [Euryarchaeota archaeon]